MPAMSIYTPSQEDLIKMGLNPLLEIDYNMIEGIDYESYERAPSLTEFKPGHTGFWKGKKKPQNPETKEKIRKTLKGVKHSDERRKKCSESHIGVKHTEQTKAKMKATRRGMLWYTNGVINTRAHICPDGFWRGQTKVVNP